MSRLWVEKCELPPSWQAEIGKEFDQDYMHQLREFYAVKSSLENNLSKERAYF